MEALGNRRQESCSKCQLPQLDAPPNPFLPCAEAVADWLWTTVLQDPSDLVAVLVAPLLALLALERLAVDVVRRGVRMSCVCGLSPEAA